MREILSVSFRGNHLILIRKASIIDKMKVERQVMVNVYFEVQRVQSLERFLDIFLE